MKRFVLTLLVATSCYAYAADDPIATFKAGQPKAVVDLIERIEGCNHWGGEEPYDAERREQIRRAVVELRCGALEADEAKLLKQFRHDEKVTKAIVAARSLFQ